MSTVSLSYAADSQLTITLASLATSSTLVAGAESDAVTNSAGYLDYLLSGRVTTGSSPTAGTIEVWVIAPIEDTPAWPDVFDGTGSAETVTSRNILFSCGRLAASMATDATSNQAYPFGQVSVAALFGGVVPKSFVVFVTHNTAVNLNSTAGNHQISVQGISQTIS